MDYLPIQASSVPCERVFLLSVEMDTKRRNHLSNLTMEALQMIKFHVKKGRLSFTAGWITSEKDMIDDIPDNELTMSFLKGDQDAMDKVMQSTETAATEEDN